MGLDSGLDVERREFLPLQGIDLRSLGSRIRSQWLYPTALPRHCKSCHSA
jgi:hypothetical protein